ncbi:serine/threonine-protein kinase [Paludisphaera rhizosphaerae]|uniref:serine/threonine-protein kinase n=1 Tax=Paludisphaera rhizosphaerae TaxID=2711216 RepID=UPI0013EAEC30|nr:serine/threonine-protein kinase [Paludisphaera rhizosphaerae]
MTDRSIFLAALEIEDPAARAAYLDQACTEDPEARARVDALLEAHQADGSFMNRPAAGVSSFEPPTELIGSLPQSEGLPPAGATGQLLAGRYLVGPEIGRGGMGTVYRAEQVAPVKRPVAVKLVNPGMDSRSVLLRFEAERQALAVMDHPNIAKVLDAGAAADGRPFFVMELVKGAPLTEYCDSKRLPVADRLELFRKVCSAVQHAHQKGVIHRDLKPSNVLVEELDGAASPKVIDFGLAKAVGGAALTEQTLDSSPGSVAGTPLYMAPEQAGAEARDVDTRADVYALGAMLYELLTGTPPIGRDTLRRAAWHEILRAIREDEPPPPSSRIGSAADLPSVAANRDAEPVRLGRFVRGDLDWVVMKALEKDRSRRYDSAAAFGADLERFLNHELVSAGPPTARYRAFKFVRRHRVAVSAVAAVLSSLAVGTVAATLGMMEARRQRDAADEARFAESAQRERADGEAAVAREVNSILTEALIGQADPSTQVASGRSPDPDLKVRTLLDGVAAGLDGRFAGRPRVEAAVRRTVGRTYQGLGAYPEAVHHLERALELARATAPLPDPETINVADDLAVTYRRGGLYDKAEKLDRDMIAQLEPTLGPDNPSVLLFVHNLGVVAMTLDRPEEARRLFERALAGREKAFGPESYEAAQVLNTLGQIVADGGDRERGMEMKRRALAVYRRILTDEAPETMIVANNVAVDLAGLGRFDEAAAAYESLTAAARRRLGPTHVDTLTYLMGLADARHSQGRDDLAGPIYRETVEAARGALPPDHPELVVHIYNLGCFFEDLRQYAEADRELADALARARRGFPPGAGQTTRILQHLIDVRFADHREKDAEPLVRELLAGFEAKQPDHWITFHLKGLLGRAMLAQGKLAEAEPLLLAAHRGLTERRAKLPPMFAAKLDEIPGLLADLYDRLGRPEEAARWRAEREKPRPKSP